MSVSLLLSLLAFQAADSGAALPDRVEIVRTEYSVPHIMAEDLEAMGFGLAYVQSEDFGASVATGLVQSRGTLARYEGRAEIDCQNGGAPAAIGFLRCNVADPGSRPPSECQG